MALTADAAKRLSKEKLIKVMATKAIMTSIEGVIM